MRFCLHSSWETFITVIVFTCVGFALANAYIENESIITKVKTEMNIAIVNLRELETQLDTIHTSLHHQSDLVDSITRDILLSNKRNITCDTDELFEEIDMKLNKIKQNLHKVINENDDKHLDKMDSILYKVKNTKACVTENFEQMTEIKTQILAKVKQLGEYLERLEALENKFEKYLVANEKKNATQNVSTKKQQQLDVLTNDIQLKLSAQETKLLKYKDHLADIKNISSIVETQAKRNWKNQSFVCKNGKCAHYRLIATDNLLKLAKV